MTDHAQAVTQYLHNWRDGDQAALDQMFPLIYQELRRIARRYLGRENDGHTLQTTELIHEAYLKLVDQQATDWQNRAHFFAVAARVMRNLLVDHARAKLYAKRGGGAERVELDEALTITAAGDANLLALDDALNRLAAFDERKSRLVELRYFGGLSVEETAEALGVSGITVKREWLKAKAWLYRELS
jgi:RNA polymerase sigma factor (TIGR02999 family)